MQLRRLAISGRALRRIGIYGVFAVTGAQLCYFNAVAHLSVAVALLLEYSGILLVVLWGWARHGHRPRRLTVVGGLISLAGLVVVLNLAGSHHVDVTGVLWGVGAAVGLAVYFVMASDTSDGLPPLAIAWSGLAVGAVLLGVAAAVGVLPVSATRADVTLLHRHVSWVVPVLGMSVVAGVVAFLTGIAAARALGAKLASFVGLTEVLFAVTFAWLLLDQRLSLMQLAGGALVVAGIALVRVDELRDTAESPATEVLPPEPQLATVDLMSGA
jgi:drug/metabolite transporter (DMT)-like permease